MADQTGTDAVPVDASLQDAWWSLYDHAARVDPHGKAPFRRLSLPDALQRLSDTDAAERLPESIRWRVLTELVRSEMERSGEGKLPHYARHGSHYQTYLRTLPSKVPPEVVAQGDEAVQQHAEQTIQGELQTPTEDICNIEQVVVDGEDAVWIFSEFETNASHEQLTKWVKPDYWPEWGPIMFKNMSPMGDPRPARSGGRPAAGEQHQDYLEVVSLAGRELHTVLRCDVKDADDWVGMSYDLVKSLDNFLTVDRGFLLATRLPSGRHIVKALKIVGFKQPVSNFLATLVCPVWTDFARQATRNAATIVPATSSLGPGTAKASPAPDAATGRSGASSTEVSALASDLSDQWIQRMSGAVSHYTAHAQNVGLKLLTGRYRREDAALDSRHLCVSLARDWARAWKAGIELVNGMAAIDLPSSAAGPAAAGGGAREFSTVAVPVPSGPVPLGITDLLHLDTDRAVLKSSRLTLSPATLTPLPGAASIDVRIEADTSAAEPGLYVGTLLVGSGKGAQRIPAHFYVSRAHATG